MGLRQTDMPSRYVAQEVEAGRTARLKVDEVRTHFTRLEASVYLNAWWRGAALDRLIDARHAVVVDVATTVMTKLGWRVVPEVTFAEAGERGSIDLFAGREDVGAVFVGEVKSEWGSIEETLRRLHVKTRLASKIAYSTFGWPARCVATALIFPEDRTARRVADRFAATLDAALPADSRAVRRWLKAPVGDLAGIWFLTDAGAAGARWK